ncbi:MULTISPECIES: Na(+)/H(+) antiporter subunit C [unclassified Luteococcus]|uniref:Na(+)/H(+) antiporter subunit C n=1 Tax=unclassified Luteococcus TaxID=2639923 RepID=UPI00313A7890
MSPNLTLAVLAGVLFGTGISLLLSRSLTRALLGVLLVSNGVNVAFLVASGPPGKPPIVDKAEAAATVIGGDGISDPLPQAMTLTAIVITLAVTGFVLALAHRQWQLAGADDVEDDAEDARIQELAHSNDLAGSDYTDTADPHALADDEEDAPPPDPVGQADHEQIVPEELDPDPAGEESPGAEPVEATHSAEAEPAGATPDSTVAEPVDAPSADPAPDREVPR